MNGMSVPQMRDRNAAIFRSNAFSTEKILRSSSDAFAPNWDSARCQKQLGAALRRKGLRIGRSILPIIQTKIDEKTMYISD